MRRPQKNLLPRWQEAMLFAGQRAENVRSYRQPLHKLSTVNQEI
jgi:hypothetical protein